ncbi:MAG: type II toxin-antitoxin system PemK/MazF family toxin [Chloroflexota bacterium]|nr:type II toxin-antitoxin system PemK/MazF family toxin [Chloroflexota bacterium]MDE2884978.1 type II toxin-antitoxin system PemK/MazF family toxin [Chloroflexota bacterium]
MAEPLRGEVWFADLGQPTGREMAMQRPVVIVKEDAANAPNLTIVVPLTSQPQRRQPAVTVDVPAGEGGLRQDSVALCYNIRVLDTAKLSHRMGQVNDARLAEIADSLSFVLGLG